MESTQEVRSGIPEKSKLESKTIIEDTMFNNDNVCKTCIYPSTIDFVSLYPDLISLYPGLRRRPYYDRDFASSI
jgi:hypothetical protein